MRARVYFWLLVCLVLRGVADASGQSLIRLDIHATLDGQPVLDLAATDIDVSEGTVPQRIDELKHVTTAARAFIVFLDTPHLRFEGVRQIRNPLAAFLDRLLDDDDLVALITPDAVPDRLAFETKQAVISDVVQDEAAWERT